ncbi:MAG TPA: thiamine-phosphate kinase [Candidatus Udaeobacter sp.]|nr:thiamine-phosphate kinase [Candidatus Udaeobacter sp.]
MSRAKRPGEFELITRYFRPLAAGKAGALGLADDAALIDVPDGRRLVVTADLLTAGVHFLDDDPPDLIARKALRVNLSDLAAMAAKPFAYFLTCAFPETVEEAWIAGFAAGLARDQEEFDIALMGGDTTATPGPLTLSITALGSVETGRELRRSTAKKGDLIAVSGTIGDAVLGLARLQGRLEPLPGDDYLIDRYRLPQPRISLALELAARGLATAALDVSDGLVADLGHICEASGLAARIEAGRLPLSPPARKAVEREPKLLEALLTGGDDYELLFTLPADRKGELAGLPVTVIGSTEEGDGVKVVDPAGKAMALRRGGFQHF